MAKPTPKKQLRKKKKEQKRHRHSAAYMHRKGAFRKFPEIVYRENGCPAELVTAVKAAAHHMVVRHEELFDVLFRGLLPEIRRVGYRRVAQTLRDRFGHTEEVKLVHGMTNIEVEFQSEIEDVFSSKLPEEIIARYFPFHIAKLVLGQPSDRQILVEFQSLARRSTPGGTAYFWNDVVPVTYGNVRRTPAFTRHAIERLTERMVIFPGTYGGHLEPFHTCTRRVFARGCELSSNQPGFALFHGCPQGVYAERFAEEVLGTYDPSQYYYYRVGYCPVVFHGELAIAKTLLLPGMTGTPEYTQILRQTARTTSELESLQSMVGKMTFQYLANSGDFSLMKQLHEGGIPQVITHQESFEESFGMHD